ncbi:MAG: hypothetical protein M0R06_02670 [Sphaerochaeta sp.]|jgi:hypothetical protein|nr:hypothetical protein [Sphaerochaeta sp.]
MKSKSDNADTPEKVQTPELQKGSGAVGAARDIVAQLKEQAGNGQIDGALIDQLDAILNVQVDEASDKQSEMKSDASSVSDVSSAPSASGTSVPSSSGLGKEDSTPPSSEPAPESTSSEPSSESSEEQKMDNSNDVEKVDEQPASARPPVANLIFDGVEDMRSKLPGFIKLMQEGKMKDAQKLAGGDSRQFDTMFNMAQHALLTEGGWTIGNLAKINSQIPGLTPETDVLQKAVTASSVPGINLIPLAKLMLPVYAGLTQRLPTSSPKGMGSTEATWRAQLGFGSISEKSFFRIAEANIGVTPPDSWLTFKSPYNDLSTNDSVTLKALRASMGYSDPLQIAVIRAMSALLRGQERVLLGSNNAAIAAPGTITVAQGAPAQTVLAAGSYVAAVTALTYEGDLAVSKGGSAAVGETAYTATSQFVLGSGSSITLTWDAIPGAVAYNVYLSGSGGASGSAAKWHSKVYVNKAVISTLPTSTNTPPTSDTTANTTYGIEGLIPWCASGSVYGNAIPDKQTILDNAAGGLTAGNGGITEFDEILASLWTTWHTAPSVMVMSPNLNATLVGKLQSLGSGTFYRVEVGAERNTVNGGMMVTGYVNKFAPFADGTPRMIDVIPHPYMPEGMVLFLSETIPYPMGNETRGFVRDVLLPYTYFPLPSQASGVNQTTYNFAITTSETLECFNPGPQAALVGVDYTA